MTNYCVAFHRTHPSNKDGHFDMQSEIVEETVFIRVSEADPHPGPGVVFVKREEIFS